VSEDELIDALDKADDIEQAAEELVAQAKLTLRAAVKGLTQARAEADRIRRHVRRRNAQPPAATSMAATPVA
jgi:hypothetical protein